MKEIYNRSEVTEICKKLRREAAKMEMLHIIAKLGLDENDARAYYSDMSPEVRCFTTAILTIDITEFL